MEIAINYEDRDLAFTVQNKTAKVKGEGAKDLLLLVGKSRDKISKIKLTGESRSYTFTRQVYLLVNLLRFLSECSLKVNGREIPKNELAGPIYS
ncbi:MAG: hypothetical protein OEV37_04040 [Candidatus Berkelbacteria bacterium]|nr:hypothetical protein [Candidatus Berkelbacteria bacterium]